MTIEEKCREILRQRGWTPEQIAEFDRKCDEQAALLETDDKPLAQRQAEDDRR